MKRLLLSDDRYHIAKITSGKFQKNGTELSNREWMESAQLNKAVWTASLKGHMQHLVITRL